MLIFLLGKCAMAECLSSADSVRSEHGSQAWSTWHTVGGRKCYMLGERHGRIRGLRNNDSLYHRIAGSYDRANMIPLPRFRASYIGTTIDDQLYRLSNTFAERWP